MKVKPLRVTYLIVIGLGFILFFIYGHLQDRNADIQFTEEEYSGIILDILFVEGNWGDPCVRVDDKWIVLGPNEDKIRNYIRIGDSIDKKGGTELITVFKKNKEGTWDKRIFE